MIRFLFQPGGNREFRKGGAFMDIDILLSLQEFRNGGGGFLTDFLSKMSFLSELNSAIVIMAVLYWCVSKELGSYLLMGWAGNRLANGVLKVTACAYRPWIRDSRILPYGNSITTATGYSFPSGHAMNGATIFGGVVVRKDYPRALRILLGFAVAFVAFSRIYLGVHTPQDVLVGAGIGILIMWLTLRLVRWVESHPGRDWLVVCIGIGLCAAVAIYAAVKPYPEDYNADGQLIVDGAKMANDTFKGVGYAAGILVGWILERRFVRFSTDVSVQVKLMRTVIGLLGYYAISLVLLPQARTWIPGAAGTILTCFVQLLYVTFLFPWLAKRLERSVS